MKKPIMMHKFTSNEHDNGGEHLTLITKFYDNGDKVNNIFTNQELILYSHCNSAHFELVGAAMDPDNLRKLSDELDNAKKNILIGKIAGI